MEKHGGVKAYYAKEDGIGISFRSGGADNAIDSLKLVFEYLVGHGVITEAFVFKTGYPEWGLAQITKGLNYSITIVPTSIPESCNVSGVWYYYRDDNNERVFYDESELFLQATLNLLDKSTWPLNMGARAAVFSQLQSQLCDTIKPRFNEIYTEEKNGGDENPVWGDGIDDPPCQGGEFADVLVWVYSPNGGDIDEIAINGIMNELNSLRESNTNNQFLSNAFDKLDGTPYSELLQSLAGYFNMNSGVFVSAAERAALEAYLEYRRQLSVLGIGNGISGILEGARHRGGDYNWHTTLLSVWVWCWEDYPDFTITTGEGGGGSTGSTNPSFWEDIQELQACVGLNEVYDIDLQSGGNESSTFTGDEELCTRWNNYVENCLPDVETDFAESYFDWQQINSPYYVWGKLKNQNPELFDEIINGDHGCVTTEEVADMVCLQDAYNDFVSKYDLTLSKPEKMALGNISDCEGVEEEAVDVISELRLELLKQIIAANPWSFIQNCLDQNPDQIPHWEDLASFYPGQEVIDILNLREGDDWNIQTLTEATGAVLNIDYFGVNFNEFPNGMNPEGFFTFVRQNFMQFDNGCNSTFNFSNLEVDNNLWNSNSPIGTIFDINIWGPDNGAVVVSQFEDSPNSCFCWTFTTITNNNSGTHPVSGNRQFGLNQESDGSWTFYTRGVDRATQNMLGLTSSIGFPSADGLWNCIMNNIQNTVDAEGLNSHTFGFSIRPDWAAVRDHILDLPITDLLECIQSSN